MKKILKQTGVALSIAMMTSGLAVADETEAVKILATDKLQNLAVEAAAEPIETSNKANREDVKVEKPAPKKVKKVKKKSSSNEVNMKSKGNYVAPLQNVSLDENNEVIETVSVEGLHVTPIVEAPKLNDQEDNRYPIDLTVKFPFKDAYGNEAPKTSLVNKNGKNVTVYQLTSDFSKLNVQSIDAFSENFQSQYLKNDCDIILYQYQMADDTEKAIEAIYLNKGRISDKQSKRCAKDDTNRKETSQIDSNGYFLNLTFNKAATIAGKSQDFSLLAMKDGKVAPIEKATTYVFKDGFSQIEIVEGTGKTKSGSHIFFNDLKLDEGNYKFIIEYVIDGKKNHIVLPKSVRK